MQLTYIWTPADRRTGHPGCLSAKPWHIPVHYALNRKTAETTLVVHPLAQHLTEQTKLRWPARPSANRLRIDRNVTHNNKHQWNPFNGIRIDFRVGRVTPDRIEKQSVPAFKARTINLVPSPTTLISTDLCHETRKPLTRYP